jgi:hypothetical protein
VTPPLTERAAAGSAANLVTGSTSDQPFVLGQAEHDVEVLHGLS